MMKKSNIEWCDFTWDPVTGCRNDCSFCESRKRLSHFKGDIRFHLSDERIHIDEERSLYVITTPLAKNGSSVPAPTGFYPTLHPYRLQQVIQKIKPANIWVCHSGDLFGEWIPTEWSLQVFEAAKQAPWHNYMFLTMNPNRYEELLETGVLMPTDNFWYGTRLTERGNVFTADGYHTFLCIEPMRYYAERMEIQKVEWNLLGGYGKKKHTKQKKKGETRGGGGCYGTKRNHPCIYDRKQTIQGCLACSAHTGISAVALPPCRKDAAALQRMQVLLFGAARKTRTVESLPTL